MTNPYPTSPAMANALHAVRMQARMAPPIARRSTFTGTVEVEGTPTPVAGKRYPVTMAVLRVLS